MKKSYTFYPTNSQALLQWLLSIWDTFKNDKEYEVTVQEKRNKRSLDANSYAWVLITRIADKLTSAEAAVSKDDIYLDMLERYGQGGIVKIPNKDIDTFKRQFKYCKEHELLIDSRAVYMRFWVGSSNYTSSEMSIFIKGIVEECRDLEIETRTPDEIALMLERWKDEEQKDKGL